MRYSDFDPPLTPAEVSGLRKFNWPGELLERHPRQSSLPRLFIREHLPTLEQLQESYMRRVLQLTGGNQRQASEILGTVPSTLYRKIVRPDRDAREDTHARRGA